MEMGILPCAASEQFTMRTLAIGDIHGCSCSLVAPLKQVRLEPDDQVIFLGDYIDHGPASRQVVGFLLELKKARSPVFLRGNHEVIILEAREDPLKSHLWESYGGLETAFSYGANFREDWASTIPVTHWTFLEQITKFVETDTHIFVHAWSFMNASNAWPCVFIRWMWGTVKYRIWSAGSLNTALLTMFAGKPSVPT
jgi:hypothetical protein